MTPVMLVVPIVEIRSHMTILVVKSLMKMTPGIMVVLRLFDQGHFLGRVLDRHVGAWSGE